MKTAEKARGRNRALKAAIRGAVKAVQTEKDPEKKTANLKAATSALDRAARKGIMHGNKAARIKSKLARKTNT
jgi:small subunit ribosomal protein S20